MEESSLELPMLLTLAPKSENYGSVSALPVLFLGSFKWRVTLSESFWFRFLILARTQFT